MIQVLAKRPAQYEGLTPYQILYLMWQFHADAWSFFSTMITLDDPDNCLPISGLSLLNCNLDSSIIPTNMLGVPEYQFLGQSLLSEDISIVTSSSGSNVGTLFKLAYNGPYKNFKLVDGFRAVAKPALQHVPNLTVPLLCKAIEALNIWDISVGYRGQSCLNYNLMRVCVDPTCNYKHVAASPPKDKVKKVLVHLGPALKEVTQNGLPGKSWPCGAVGKKFTCAVSKIKGVTSPTAKYNLSLDNLFPAASAASLTIPKVISSPLCAPVPNVLPGKTPKQSRWAWHKRLSLMQPQAHTRHHPLQWTLKHWATQGCPADCGPEWAWENVMAAVECGPHRSTLTPNSIDLFYEDVGYQVAAGFCEIMLWSNLVKPQDLSSGSNTPMESMRAHHPWPELSSLHSRLMQETVTPITEEHQLVDPVQWPQSHHTWDQ